MASDSTLRESTPTSAPSPSLRQWAVKNFPSWLHPPARQAVLTATSVVGTALRALPGDSRQFGPPRGIAPTLAGYAAHHPTTASYRELYPAHDLRREPPESLEERLHPAFEADLHRRAWAAGLGTLENGRVVTESGAILTPDDALIYDVSHTAASDDPRSHPIYLARRLPRPTRFEESVAVITTFTSNVKGMYYFVHWLLDTLPRLHLVEKSGISWDKLVAPQATRFQRDTLALLGVPSERIIADGDLHIEAARLIVPTLPHLPVNPTRWTCDYLRYSFIPRALAGARALAPGRKLYLSRAKAKTRRIANEAALMAAIEPLGFEFMMLEDYPFLEQVRILQEASIVIAPHGAANAGLVFCNPGTVFIEMFSPRYVNVCYWSLANMIGLNYGYVLGDGKAGGRQAHEDIVAPVEKLLTLMARMS